MWERGIAFFGIETRPDTFCQKKVDKIGYLQPSFNDEYGCVGAPSVIALAGLNVNLPPTGSAALPPELFVVNQDECSVLSFSADPGDQLLELDCDDRGEPIKYRYGPPMR